MLKYKYIIIFALFIHIGFTSAQEQTNSSQVLEYKIKAAFLFNFIKFVDWPKEKANIDKATIIGIIGKNNFGDAFDPVKDKKVKGQESEIIYFKSYDELVKNKIKLEQASEEMKKCHLLFICSSEKDNIVDILNIVKNNNVLTVGETKDFLESNGIINFILEDNKVRFEINLISARESKLIIRSQLLRLAQRVIEDKEK